MNLPTPQQAAKCEMVPLSYYYGVINSRPYDAAEAWQWTEYRCDKLNAKQPKIFLWGVAVGICFTILGMFLSSKIY